MHSYASLNLLLADSHPGLTHSLTYSPLLYPLAHHSRSLTQRLTNSPSYQVTHRESWRLRLTPVLRPCHAVFVALAASPASKQEVFDVIKIFLTLVSNSFEGL